LYVYVKDLEQCTSCVKDLELELLELENTIKLNFLLYKTIGQIPSGPMKRGLPVFS
jgi:hypothetical protein